VISRECAGKSIAKIKIQENKLTHIDSILEGLNEPQSLAVRTIDGPLLIFAGAGSGKTRVLTRRIAYILAQKKTFPDRILAVTFTNKAAREMVERLQLLLGDEVKRLNVGTFHSINARILRREAKNLEIDPNFTIFDTQDSKAMLKEAINACNYDPEQVKPAAVQHIISAWKQKRLSPTAAKEESAQSIINEKYAYVYEAYEALLKKNHAFDFDDLLLKPLEYFEQRPDFLKKYQYRYDYLLVDEYQDTNLLQFQFVHYLSGLHQNICVVGDDDQSIYGWRGADIRNILQFESAFPGAKVIKLEQNYRSTKTILEAAAAVVRNNQNRRDKNIWSDSEQGEKISLAQVQDGRAEAAYIAAEIQKQTYSGKRLSDMAILYRTNAQSRQLEEAMRDRLIRYTIVGGTRFYERKEIKDLLAYLNLLVNPDNDLGLKRIINVPARKIGATSIEKLENFAAKTQRSLWLSLQYPREAGLTPQAANAVRQFNELIRYFQSLLNELPAPELVRLLIEKSGLIAQYNADSKERENQERIANIEEFVSGVEQFITENEGATLTDYLQNVALLTDVDQWSDQQDSVVMMTLHSAKGLEFPVVFIAGMDDGLFPLERAKEKDEEMEEERRLFYVGLTRAMKKIYLITAEERLRYGMSSSFNPSPFLDELPADCIENTRSRKKTNSPYFFADSSKRSKSQAAATEQSTPAFLKPQKPSHPSGKSGAIKVGQRILHQTYGKGTVKSITIANQKLLKIQFDMGITKTIAEKFVQAIG
jgi:DNA helicase II / ATP-dependent DNA helicase PcrA